MKKGFRYIFICLILIGLIFGGYYTIKLQENNSVISFSDELYLIIEDILIEDGNPVLLEDGEIYFKYEIVKEYIDENIFYDETEKIVVITDRSRVIRYKLDEKVATLNSKEFLVDHAVKYIDNKVYIPLEILDSHNIDVNYYPETSAVVVDYTDIYYLNGEVVQTDGNIRTNLDRKSPILVKDLEIGTSLNVYGEYEEWYKIRTKNGILGFMEKKYIKLNHTKELYKTELLDRENQDIANNQIINLTWDYTYGKLQGPGNIKELPGINVISPTWFSVIDADGSIRDKGNQDYVSKYKELGYEIWALIDNSFDPQLTHDILKSSINREKLINDILDIYLDYGFQGINIDFENINLEDKDLLTQFVRELYPIFKENNMIVSMAISPMSTSENWSKSYDRNRLAKATDYLMLMAYDQHWASSPIAGSVAQYSWVEDSIIGVLEEIPREKLILAVPYYTRLWIEEDEKLWSQALSMDIANNFVDEKDLQLVWDEESMQYYGEMKERNRIYKIWLEDNKSLEYKISLIHKYDLAGVASWRKGFETQDIWNTIANALN